MTWTWLSPWWHINLPPFVSCRETLHSSQLICVPTRVTVHRRVFKCVCSSQHSYTLNSFPLLFPCPHPSTPLTTPPLPMPFLSAWEAEARPGGTDLTLRPPGDTGHYFASVCLTVQPVIPARTKIASAGHPHILCLLAVTYALTTVPVIVL